MQLFFPQWQGSGDRQMYTAATTLQAALPAYDWQTVAVTLTDAPTEHQVHQRSALIAQFEQARALLRAGDYARVLTLGGDCNVAIAPIEMLNRRYAGDLLVLWFDQHADLNTPASSPSGNFHGMPVRHALGEGDSALRAHDADALTPAQIVYIGAADFDAAESDYIAQHEIRVLSVTALRDNPALFEQMLIQQPYQHVYLHIDADCLDRTDFAGTGYPNDQGFALDDLIGMVADAAALKSIVGATLTHYNTTEPDALGTLALIFNTLDELMENRLLS